ncbi:unnamed protein product, partial [marine sediment metagenome]
MSTSSLSLTQKLLEASIEGSVNIDYLIDTRYIIRNHFIEIVQVLRRLSVVVPVLPHIGEIEPDDCELNNRVVFHYILEGYAV